MTDGGNQNIRGLNTYPEGMHISPNSQQFYRVTTPKRSFLNIHDGVPTPYVSEKGKEEAKKRSRI